MNLNELILKVKTLDNDIKKVNDQKTIALQEAFPYSNKCIEVIRDNTLWYIKCNDVLFEDRYFTFKGNILKVQDNGFSFKVNDALYVIPATLNLYTFREISEEQFDECVNQQLHNIIQEYNNTKKGE